jgi:hypothetical protein
MSLEKLDDGVAILRQVREAARDTTANPNDVAWIDAEIVAGRRWLEDAKAEAAASPF